ncbi:MAG: sulfatase-like hydrolase/transferase [Bacteroidota bacterium]
MKIFKKKFNLNLHTILFLRITFLIVLFTFSRFLFYLFNLTYFSGISVSDFVKIVLSGFRFDISAILILNSAYIVLWTIPLKMKYNRIYIKVTDYLFYIINSIALMANFIDIIYYRFTFKRTTGDIFSYLGVGGDFNKLLPQFLKDFWYILIIYIVFVFILILTYNIFKVKESINKGYRFYLNHTIAFLISVTIIIIGIRGGFQLKPIDIINAGTYTDSKNIPIVLNTPFTIIKTINYTAIQKQQYYKDKTEIESIYNPCHTYNDTNKTFRKLNVVVIILESFSKEHIGALNNMKGYSGFTPFIDSLIGQSLVFNGFANGKRSIEGIPAVLSSMPTLMNEAYISSSFVGDKISSIADLLKQKGYHTSFFHGGTNGTMGFDAFTKIAGFDHYFGRHEYNNEQDYDGKWGIKDEEFLQYYANKLNSFPQPFLSSIFTLSSHHPYTVPAKYAGKFKKGKMEIQEAIGYSDYSLKRFFETASKMSWFDSTLFVITADHTSEAALEYYQNSVGMYAVPIIFYMHGSNLKGMKNVIAQQIDIMPSILDYLNYDNNYFSFGTSVFDTNAAHFNISYINGNYQLIKDNYALRFDGTKCTTLFDIKNDPMLTNNLINKETKQRDKMEAFIKAVIQQYNNRIIENKLTISN